MRILRRRGRPSRRAPCQALKMGLKERGLKGKKGFTLVETIVTLLLISILMVMVAGILSPAAKVFLRMQKLQFAQVILDNTILELESLALGATEYVKVYDDGAPGSIAEKGGAGSGKALEFVNTEGYVVLISAQGCEETQLMQGDVPSGSAKAREGGRLLLRYYLRKDGTYGYTLDGKPAARAVNDAFPANYYLGNYLEIIFTLPGNNGEKVTSATAEVSLYSDEDLQDLVITDTAVLDFRYQVEKKTAVTAKAGVSAGG